MKNYIEVRSRAVEQNAMGIREFCSTVVASKIVNVLKHR
jgi:hypothetical protein